MSTNDSNVEVAYREALNEHYGVPDLGTEILDALKDAGMDVDALTRDDITTFDEFHIRGREATRELANLAEIAADARVLDVGCGVGGPARTLAAEFDCIVAGIDLVEEYCHAAELFTELVGMSDSVKFQEANALDLPFADGRFDVIWFEHTLMNIEDKEQAFEEAGRVLGPGGRLALYEIGAGPGGDPVFPVPWASDPSLSYLAAPEPLREGIIDGGFDEIIWRDVTEPSLKWFRNVVESMQSRPMDAPPPTGLNLLMGPETLTKATNVVRNLEEDRITVVQGVFKRGEDLAGTSSRTSGRIDW